MIRSNRIRRATLKARALTTIRRVHRAALTMPKALRYRCLSGQVIVAVEAGHLVRTGDILERLGAGDLKDGYQSWYGRHVAKAYRAARETEPTRCWVRHRTTGRWVHVFVYSPFEIALYVGLATYKQTKHLAQPAHFQAAYTAAA